MSDLRTRASAIGWPRGIDRDLVEGWPIKITLEAPRDLFEEDYPEVAEVIEVFLHELNKIQKTRSGIEIEWEVESE